MFYFSKTFSPDIFSYKLENPNANGHSLTTSAADFVFNIVMKAAAVGGSSVLISVESIEQVFSSYW